MEQFKDRVVHVVGLGVEGTALANYFLSRGGVVTVHHKFSQRKITRNPQLSEVQQDLSEQGVTFKLGRHYLDTIETADYIGILQSAFSYVHRADNQKLYQLYQRQPEIFYTDLKIFFAEDPPATVVGVTGSKGKTTTTDLLSKVLSRQGQARAGGNIGRSPLEFLDELEEEDLIVLEISNYQLEFLEESPDIAVLLNITPDHLVDYGGDFEKYRQVKQRLLRFQEPQDYKVINLDDKEAAASANIGQGKLFPYSFVPLKEGAFIEDGQVKVVQGGDTTVIMETDQIPFPGVHNLSNVLAVVATAHLLGITPVHIRQAILDYQLISHRLETVRTIAGVKFVNDSKATTPAATSAALQSYPASKVVLIAGGKKKGLPMGVLGEIIDQRVKAVVLLGENADKIARSISKVETNKASSLSEAVDYAFALAEEGDVVLLSPASASFDMFDNYKDRGDQFKDYVNQLTK